MKKPLSSSELISLLPASTDELRSTIRAFEDYFPTLYRDRAATERAIVNRVTIPRKIAVSDVPAFLFSYHVTTDGGLWVDLAHTIKPGVSPGHLFAGVEEQAAILGAPYISFSTQRRGMVRLASQYGYAPESVSMTKEVAA